MCISYKLENNVLRLSVKRNLFLIHRVVNIGVDETDDTPKYQYEE